jgi:toxin ParE1/3/4
MTLPIRLRATAEQDVASYAEFLQRDSLDAALRFLDAANAAFALLGKTPYIGAPCRYQKPHYEGLRAWPVAGFKKCLIFYRVVSGEVEVIRVLHGARDLQIVFGEED